MHAVAEVSPQKRAIVVITSNYLLSKFDVTNEIRTLVHAEKHRCVRW